MPAGRLGLLLAVAVAGSLSAPRPARADTVDDFFARLGAAGKGTRTLAAKFVQRKRLALFKSEVKSSGLFYFQRPQRIRWETHPPDQALLLVDGDRAEFRAPGEPKRVLDLKRGGAAAGLVSDVLVWFGVRPATALRQSYDVKLEGAGPASRLTLVPKQQALRQRVSRIRLEVAPDLLLRSVELVQADGDRTVVEFSGVRRNAGLPPDAFRAP